MGHGERQAKDLGGSKGFLLNARCFLEVNGLPMLGCFTLPNPPAGPISEARRFLSHSHNCKMTDRNRLHVKLLTSKVLDILL